MSFLADGIQFVLLLQIIFWPIIYLHYLQGKKREKQKRKKIVQEKKNVERDDFRKDRQLTTQKAPPALRDQSIWAGHVGYATRMGANEPNNLYPGTYYLCLEKNGSSILRMNRPRDKNGPVRVVFVADPRRLCQACHYSKEHHSELMWRSMLIYAKSGCVDGYCLIPPGFNTRELTNYVLCAGRNDGLLMYIETPYFDREKHIKLSKRYVDVIHIVSIEESDPETTLLLSSSPKPAMVPKDLSCLLPLPNRFCPPWQKTSEVRKRNWRCVRLLLSVHQAVPVPTKKKEKREEEEGFFQEKERFELKQFESRLKKEIKGELEKVQQKLIEEERERLREEQERERKDEEERLRKEKEKEQKQQKLRKEEEEKQKREEEEERRMKQEERGRREEERVREEMNTFEELFKIDLEQNDIKRVQILLKMDHSNGLVNRPLFEFGNSSLHKAAGKGFGQIVKILLERGANIGALNQYGETPLHCAADRGFGNVVEILMERGANMEAENKFGRTPLHYATNRGYDQIVQILLKRKPNIKEEEKVVLPKRSWSDFKG